MPEDPKEHPDPHQLKRFMRNETAERSSGRSCAISSPAARGAARCTRRLWDLGEARPPVPEEDRPEWLELEDVPWPDDERQPALVAAALHRHASLLFEDGGGRRRCRRCGRRGASTTSWAISPTSCGSAIWRGRSTRRWGPPGRRRRHSSTPGAATSPRGWGEAAAVLLDLAILYTREGRGAEIRPFAEDLLPILRTRDLRQGVAAALLFFRRLVETGHADLEVLAEVSRYVNDPPRERREPALINSPR